MEKFRIKEMGGKFYPERYVNCLFIGYWTYKWKSMFINGEWCGPEFEMEFLTIKECEDFIESRKAKYHIVK